jgi:Mg2+ and Co2+ transporter CorA
MDKLTITVNVTELEIFKDLIKICTDFYLDMPEDMRIKYDELEDKLKENKS